MDRAIRDSDRLGMKAQDEVEAAYDGIVTPILVRYRPTIERIEKYNEQGKRGLARSLFRSSGLLDDLVEAITGAGKKASQAVQRQRVGILEVMADDDGS